MKLHRLFRLICMAPFGEEGGGGGEATPEPSADATGADAAPQAPASAPAAPAAPPATMFDAISKGLEQAAPGQPRDELGRWAPKLDATGAVIPGQVQPPGTTLAPATPPVVAADADPLSMPEGLGPKAQERFQKLANTVKEKDQQLDEARRQTEYVRETFQSNGVKREQFEQAVGVIAMFNRGDYEGAQRILEDQLKQIALITGRAPNQVDALADFPDLRQAVEGLQVTEQHALEIARSRAQQNVQQATQQRQRATFETQQESQRAHEAGTKSVDDFCKRMQSSDLDYAAIEAQLLPVIPQMLEGVPPARWGQIVQAQYQLIKNASSRARQAAPSAGGNALRPTGNASPQQAPKSTYEAMWGAPARA